MKKTIITAILFFSIRGASSQELYVFSEPASNMPAKSLGIKLTGKLYNTGAASVTQRYMPEFMMGINKSWMVHGSSTFSNIYSQRFRLESGKLYAKYRFYSSDDVHQHFRMAAFADAALTRNPYIYDEMNLDGDNSGVQVGMIATQLVNKFALSSTASYTKIFRSENLHHSNAALNGLNYALSAGLLVLPKQYVSYNQTNLNVYLELLGMRSLDNHHYTLDLAPALQLIFNSNSKINIGYRFQVKGNMNRISTETYQISLERTIFNVLN